MATAVQLTLSLDAGGALSGLDKFKQSFTKFFTDPGTTGGNNAPAKSLQQIEQQSHIAGQAFTNLTGVVMPRGVENWIAKSKLVSSALSSGFGLIVGGTIGVAFVDLGIKAVGALSNIMDSLGGYTDAVKKMQAETVKASESAFLNPKTLGDARSHLTQINTEIDKLAKQQKDIESGAASGGFLASLGGVGAASQAQAEDAQYGQTVDKTNTLLQQRQTVLENMVPLIEKVNQAEAASKLNEAGLQGFALISQQYHDALATINAAGIQDQKVVAAQYRAAYGDAEKARTDLERQGADAVIALRHSVNEESLSGIAKVHQVEVDAIEDINRKEAESLVTHASASAQRALITQRAAEQERQAYAALAQQQRDAELFAQQRANSFLQGSAKIIADSDAEKQAILNDQQKVLDNAKSVMAPEYVAAWKDAGIKITAIDSATNQQIIVNHQQLVDRLHDMQSAAAIAALPEWQRADAQILLDHQKTLEQIGRAEAVDAQNSAVYDAQRVAADQLANAQIVDAHRQMVQQLGSDLQSIFDDIGSGNIGTRILNNMKKLFAQIVAAWLLSTKLMGSGFGKLFGTLVGGPQSSLENVSGGGLLTGLFGGQSSNLAFAGTGAGGTAFGGTSAFGGGASSTSNTGDISLFSGGLFGPGSGSGALTGSPVGSITQAATSGGIGIGPLSASKGLAGFFGAGGPALSAAGLGAILGGSKLGIGGAIGGTLLGLLLMGKLSPLISASFGSLGLAATGALFGGAVGGGIGFGLGENFGKGIGIAGGAGSGALAGFLVGGPVGALLGGIIGALGGLFGGIFGGSGRKRQANQLYDGTIGPDITQIEAQYKGHQLDYASAIGQLEDLRTQAHDQLHRLKGEGDSIFKHKVSPAIDAAEADISGFETERARRSGLAFAPPEFHTGGFVDVASFSTMFRRRPNELLSVLQDGEAVIGPKETANNKAAIANIMAGGRAGALINGNIIINPQGPLDRAYVNNPLGFKRDVLAAIAQLRSEGRL